MHTDLGVTRHPCTPELDSCVRLEETPDLGVRAAAMPTAAPWAPAPPSGKEQQGRPRASSPSAGFRAHGNRLAKPSGWGERQSIRPSRRTSQHALRPNCAHEVPSMSPKLARPARLSRQMGRLRLPGSAGRRSRGCNPCQGHSREHKRTHARAHAHTHLHTRMCTRTPFRLGRRLL